MENELSYPFIDGVLVSRHAGANIGRDCSVIIVIIIIPIVFFYCFLSEIFIQILSSLSSLETKEQQYIRLQISLSLGCKSF